MVVWEAERELQWKHWQRWACELGLAAGFEGQRVLRIGALYERVPSRQLEVR